MNVEGEIIINSFKTHTFKALLFDSSSSFPKDWSGIHPDFNQHNREQLQ